MGNLGWPEIAVIVVVALVVLGPDKLPQAAQQVGSMIRAFRKISTGFRQELQNALEEPLEAEARQRGKEAVAQSQQVRSQQAEAVAQSQQASHLNSTAIPQESANNTPSHDSS